MSKQIEIPFRDDMANLVMQGKKTGTSRTKKYGEAGDWFKVGDWMIFELVSVENMLLWKVRDLKFKEEGFAEPDEFRKVWDQEVWFHLFKFVEPEYEPDDEPHDEGPSDEELTRETEENERREAGQDGGQYL